MDETSPAAPDGDHRPLNVLLIVIDTLGAEHVGCSYKGQPTTPHLDRLAKGGVQFRRAYSTAPWTKPAIASIFTGMMPSAHGVRQPLDRLPDDPVVLARRFDELGYYTGAIVSNMLVSAPQGYDQGFDSFDDSLSLLSEVKITSSLLTDRALSWLSDDRGEPFFLFLHYFDPHYVYLHHDGFDRTSGYEGPIKPGTGIWKLRKMSSDLSPDDIDYIRGLYHEEVAYTDEQIGRVLDYLDSVGLSKNTFIVVTADHGEEFMQRGWIGHTRTLYEELVHVPLIVSLPGRFQPRVIDTPVSILDIEPTILSVVGASVTEPRWNGISLLPMLSGQPAPQPGRGIISEVSFEPSPNTQQAVEKAAHKTSLVRGKLKVIHDLPTDSWQVFDLEHDPLEQNDLVGEKRKDGLALIRALEDWEAVRTATAGRQVEQWQPSEEDRERMRALGYVE